MPSLRFGVAVEGNPVIRSSREVSEGKTPMGYTFRVTPPESLGAPYRVERDWFDTEGVNRADRFHRAGHTTIVEVPMEWIGEHSHTWRDQIIDLALQQFATPPFISSATALKK
jgi:hypothetical protein